MNSIALLTKRNKREINIMVIRQNDTSISRLSYDPPLLRGMWRQMNEFRILSADSAFFG